MADAKRQDMGTCNVKKTFARLAIPAVVAQLINMLYNIVDRIYIGHIEGVGTDALTGVGVFMPVTILLTAFAMMVGAGGAPLAAIAMGQGDDKKAERIMGNCFTMLLGLSLVLTVIFYAGAPTLLRWFGASDITLPYALTYGRIYTLGTVFVLMVMGMNLFISTQGLAKLSMMTTVIGAVINIVLDPILIFGFKMGVAGAAMATVFSQAVSAVWVLCFLFGKKTGLRLQKKNMMLVSSVVNQVLSLGVSTFVMMSTESLLMISFNRSLQTYGGDIAVGAMTIIGSVSQLINMPMSGMCQGCQPLISYNFGAGLKPRVKEAFSKQRLYITHRNDTCLHITLFLIFQSFFDHSVDYIQLFTFGRQFFSNHLFGNIDRERSHLTTNIANGILFFHSYLLFHSAEFFLRCNGSLFSCLFNDSVTFCRSIFQDTYFLSFRLGYQSCARFLDGCELFIGFFGYLQ